MKIPLSWLKEFIPLKNSAEQIAKTLTLAGLEVDAIENTGSTFSNVVVVEVLETEKHPNADKLCVAKVTDGTEVFQVVCGAPNCKKGMKTAFARVGATLQDETGKVFTVKNSKIRDVESFGMLCSRKELLLGQESEGIIEFDPHVTIGKDLKEMYADSVFEISLTPNLGHCSSVLGIARELSAAYQSPLQLPELEIYEDDFLKVEGAVHVDVQCPEKALRYACRLVKDVTIAPSPKWLQERLIACSIRPINNVVDITNYVMMAFGNPLHAFDYDRIEDSKIIVRCANDDETFISLDGNPRNLTKEDLLICDGKKAIAIAGVMGGQNSEIQDQTKNVLIESACFLPSSIRKTSKRLSLQTDSSKRFERGTDPNVVLLALDLCASLMQKLASGKIAKGVLDIKKGEFTEKIIPCRLTKMNELLGTHFSASEVESIFKRLEMSSTLDSHQFLVKVPTYRNDVQTEIDLVEEVARIYGYDNIPKATPRYMGSTLPHSPMYLFEKEIRMSLIGQGLQEFLNCDLIGPTVLNVVSGPNMPEDAIVKVLNPTSVEQSILRTSLLPGLLQAVKYNSDHQNQDMSCFEIGRIHFKEEDKYKEQSLASILLTGKKAPMHWSRSSENVDFYDLKGIVENLLQELGIKNTLFKESHFKTFHDTRQAAILVGDIEIGSIGEIHPSIQRKLDVSGRILFAELNLHDLYPLKKQHVKFSPLPVYPSSTRDWTITLKEEVTYDQILQIIHAVPHKLLEKVMIIPEIYRSEKLGEGLKNMTFRFIYRDAEKTILQEDVDAEHATIVNESTKKLK